jgi:hypothetical protein
MTPAALLQRAVTALFGDAAHIVSPRQVPHQARFHAIPGNSGYRWIVPARAELGLTVLNGWRPYSAASKLKWQTILAAYRAGVLSRVPGVKTFGVIRAAAPFCAALQDSVAVVYIGTPGKSRKAVASFVSPDGQIRGILKTPLVDTARAKILREADALRAADRQPAIAPRLLWSDASSGSALQEYCSGHAAPLEFRDSYLHWLMSLEAPGQTFRLDHHVAELRRRLAQFPEGDKYLAHLSGPLAWLDDPCELPAFMAHGDFAPWNLKLSPEGDIRLAVDWEDFRPSAPPLFDYFHYNFLQAFLFQRDIDWPSLLDRCRPYVRHFDLADDQPRKLAAAYLADGIVSRLEDGHPEHADWNVTRLLKLASRVG